MSFIKGFTINVYEVAFSVPWLLLLVNVVHIYM